MGAHTRRNAVVATVVVAAAVAAFAIVGGSGGSGGSGNAGKPDASPGQAASDISALSVVTPTGDQSSASQGDATPGAAADASATTPSSSASGPGGYANDGSTPLSEFPSLVKFDQAFGAGGGRVVTTIDPRYQRAAASAVTAPDSAMVVLRADTGEILAMASNGPADLAYHAERAPGSTFKVVTAEDLLRNGLTPSSPAPCPAKDPTFGITNDDTGLTNSAATLRYGFVYSCNTSFTGLMSHLDDHPLDQEATTYFGLNQPWNLGLGPTVYGAQNGVANVLSAKDYAFASEMFGQGPISVSPLNMAAVAATVAVGQFHQPFLVPGTRATAQAQPLGRTVDAELREMMRAAVTEGTASSLKAVSPAVSAKTGTAQPGDGGGNDSWMIAFQGDIAVACLVEHGGHGNEAAGPEIAAMFGALH